MIRICVLLLIGASAGCSQTAPEKEQNEADPFRTTAPSKLYFNNIRQTHYQVERLAGTDIDLYMNRRLLESDLVVMPVIADDWMQDRATIQFFDRKDSKPLSYLALRIRKQGKTDSLTCSLLTPDCAYELAKSMHSALSNQQDLDLRLSEDGAWLPWFESRGSRSSAAAVFRDYFKLVEAD